MSRAERLPHWVYRLFNQPRKLYRFGFGQKVGPPLIILTTIGRKSGLPRETPLQYELIDGVYYAGSMRGDKADWYRNILAEPRVTIQVGDETMPALAEAIDDTDRVLAFLKYRLDSSPRMIAAIMRADGLASTDDESLRSYVEGLTVVAIRPVDSEQ